MTELSVLMGDSAEPSRGRVRAWPPRGRVRARPRAARCPRELCCAATLHFLRLLWSGVFSKRKKHFLNLLKMGDKTKTKLILLEILCLLCSSPVGLV